MSDAHPNAWRFRQLAVPALFVGALVCPWAWGGPGCVVTAEAGVMVAIHDGIDAVRSLDTHLWADPQRRVVAALSSRLAVFGWLTLVAWIALWVAPGGRARRGATRAAPLAAGVVSAQLFLHDVGSLPGLALAAGCWTAGAAAGGLWLWRDAVRPARAWAGLVVCLGAARLLHGAGAHLFGGSLAAVLLGAVVWRATRAVAAATAPADEAVAAA